MPKTRSKNSGTVVDASSKLTIGVVDTGSKFVGSVTDTGGHIFPDIYIDGGDTIGKLATSVNNAMPAVNFPPVSKKL
jgi:hypothetical protein